MRSGEILRVMLWQHKLKKREAEGYCADVCDHMKWNYIKTLYEQKIPRKESAPKTFIDIKDDQCDQ